jgi:hypothetical protein
MPAPDNCANANSTPTLRNIFRRIFVFIRAEAGKTHFEEFGALMVELAFFMYPSSGETGFFAQWQNHSWGRDSGYTLRSNG